MENTYSFSMRLANNKLNQKFYTFCIQNLKEKKPELQFRIKANASKRKKKKNDAEIMNKLKKQHLKACKWYEEVGLKLSIEFYQNCLLLLLLLYKVFICNWINLTKAHSFNKCILCFFFLHKFSIHSVFNRIL